MLAPRRPRRAASRNASRRCGSPRPHGHTRQQEQLLTWFAEAIHLTEIEGRATARLWHERLRAPDGLSRESSNRQWERLKIALVEHGVPHDLEPVPVSDDCGEAPGAVSIRVRVGKVGIHRYAAKLKRCAAVKCAKRLPPRAPFFHRDPTRPDGLSRKCAECQNAANAALLARGLAEPMPERAERLARRRASWRVASARRRLRLARVAAVRNVNNHEAQQSPAGTEKAPAVKNHDAEGRS